MEEFLKKLEKRFNLIRTENNAFTNETTNDPVLDFFATCGSLRSRSKKDIIDLFRKAWGKDASLAMKALFYARDIREGLGERRTFRIILEWIGNRDALTVLHNLENIPFYGRWDDLYALFDTSSEHLAADFMNQQFVEDLNSETPSLLGKWLKSENASSEETKRLAAKTRKHFNMSPKEYRKSLSLLRKRIGVVEKKMSENRWEEINFEEVPSKASLIYKDAFRHHQPDRYEEFMNDVEEGTKKINASDLFPYEIVRRIFGGDRDHQALSNLWDNLPQYDCTEDNALTVVDTSGSMTHPDKLPLSIAVSLGLYIAEHNEGYFSNKFITFSEEPKLQNVVSHSIIDRVKNLSKAEWGHNTNIEKVFQLILSTAVDNDIYKDKMPKKVYIISDMEFDGAVIYDYEKGYKTLFEKIKDRFGRQGYEMPQLVFWNVNARNTQFPVQKDEVGNVLVSGGSPHIFDMVINSKDLSPYQFMLKALESERYERVSASGL